MNRIWRLTKIGLPTTVVLTLAWVSNRIIRNEESLRDREI